MLMKRSGKNRKSAHLKVWSAVPARIATETVAQGTLPIVQAVDDAPAEANSLLEAVTSADQHDAANHTQTSAMDSVLSSHSTGVEVPSDPIEEQSVMADGESTATLDAEVTLPESLGQRLAAAREQRGWSCDETARRLRLPSQIVRSIEADQFERIGYGVYLRGYLSSYARLVDVPMRAVDEVLHQQVKAPDLIASGRISHSRFLFERYSGSAVYLVLTGFIVVPFVMFAMNLGGDVGSRLTPLDVSPQTLALPDSATGEAGKGAVVGGSSTTPADASGAIGSNPAAANNEAPLMASFAMFPNQPAAAAAPVAPAPSGQVRLSLTEASWVEIVDADGKRLEYATLPAGTVKNYASDKPLDMRLGNTLGAKLEVSGQVEDISPYNRGNVAHFKLFAAGKPISRSE
jgi:cytoskeleton protein RodZ